MHGWSGKQPESSGPSKHSLSTRRSTRRVSEVFFFSEMDFFQKKSMEFVRFSPAFRNFLLFKIKHLNFFPLAKDFVFSFKT